MGKIRDISKLPYDPDRIVHHAIVNVIGKKRIRSFIRDTFCCIKEEVSWEALIDYNKL